MKTITILVAISILLAFNAYAVTVKKVSDTVFETTETKEVVTTDQTTIRALKEEKANLEAQKDQALTNYNETVAGLDAKIAEIDSLIKEAEKLGVKEMDTEGNII